MVQVQPIKEIPKSNTQIPRALTQKPLANSSRKKPFLGEEEKIWINPKRSDTIL